METPAGGRVTVRPGLLAIGMAFFRLGAIAFGGLGAAIALLDRELVQKRRWIDGAALADALAFTKPLPGSTAVQVIAFLGWRLGGWPGTAVATTAFLLPATILMIVAAAGAAALPDAPWVRGAFVGVQVAVVGLLAAALWRLTQSEAKGWGLKLLLLVSAIAGLVLNAAVVVIAAGLIGVVLSPHEMRRV